MITFSIPIMHIKIPKIIIPFSINRNNSIEKKLGTIKIGINIFNTFELMSILIILYIFTKDKIIHKIAKTKDIAYIVCSFMPIFFANLNTIALTNLPELAN